MVTHFDRWGIPHIYAENESDMYHALGYLHAQDRLFQMEILRRLGRGELAAIVGKKALPVDKLHRTMRISQHAKKLAKNMKASHPATLAAQAYIDGLNTFIEKGPTPLEFRILGIPKRAFSIEDSFVIAGIMALRFSKALRTDPVLTYVRDQLGPEYLRDLGFRGLKTVAREKQLSDELTSSESFLQLIEAQLAATAFSDTIAQFDGSNAWVLSGKITKSGKPILASDPHVAFASPSVWYEANLNCPGFHLYGHHIAGIPTALLGHNEDMGWALTMLQNKDIRFYAEKTNPNNPSQVWHEDRWQEISETEEIINVRNGESVPIKIKMVGTRVVINSALPTLKEHPAIVSVDWSFGRNDNHLLEAFYELPRTSESKRLEVLPRWSNHRVSIFFMPTDKATLLGGHLQQCPSFQARIQAPSYSRVLNPTINRLQPENSLGIHRASTPRPEYSYQRTTAELAPQGTLQVISALVIAEIVLPNY